MYRLWINSTELPPVQLGQLPRLTNTMFPDQSTMPSLPPLRTVQERPAPPPALANSMTCSCSKR